MNGYIVDRKLNVCCTFSSKHGAFGGHLEKGTTVFTFAIVTVSILSENSSLHRVDDKTYC